MFLIFGWVVIGIVVGWGIASFLEGRGGLQYIWNVVAGGLGGGLTGFLFLTFGLILFGDGMVVPASFLAAIIGAFAVVFLVRLIAK